MSNTEKGETKQWQVVCIPSMSTTKKMLYLRNTVIILVLVTLALCCLFPAVLHDRQLLRPGGRSGVLQPLVFVLEP